MPSPFPGMDPYLEDPAFWQDFHSRFINACSEVLSDRLPPQYEARIDERVRLVDRAANREAVVLPDVAITGEGRAGGAGGIATATATPTASIDPVPNEMPFDAEQVHDRWIEVRLKRDRTLVTAIELLSPTNKVSVGYWEYRAKRINLLYRHANLVELDLLLGGRRLDLRDPLPSGDYYAYVSREELGPHVDVYAWTLRDPLPTIPVPLRPPDPDVGLNLGEVFAIAYERGRYARSLGYDAAPAAPLGGDALAWARDLASTIRR